MNVSFVEEKKNILCQAIRFAVSTLAMVIPFFSDAPVYEVTAYYEVKSLEYK